MRVLTRHLILALILLVSAFGELEGIHLDRRKHQHITGGKIEIWTWLLSRLGLLLRYHASIFLGSRFLSTLLRRLGSRTTLATCFISSQCATIGTWLPCNRRCRFIGKIAQVATQCNLTDKIPRNVGDSPGEGMCSTSSEGIVPMKHVHMVWKLWHHTPSQRMTTVHSRSSDIIHISFNEFNKISTKFQQLISRILAFLPTAKLCQIHPNSKMRVPELSTTLTEATLDDFPL